MKNILTLSLFILFSCYSLAQEKSTEKECPCCSENHQQFDFWIGNWDVYDVTDKKVGTNRIESVQDHCVLRENWKSPNSTGTSNNYFNKTDSTWNQVWVDNFGNPLVLKGGLENGSMVMRSEKTKGQKIAFYYNRITWVPEADGSVVQIWDAVDENDKVLKEIFRGVYKKAVEN